MKVSVSHFAKVGGTVFATILAPLLVAIASKYTDAVVPAPAASAESSVAGGESGDKPSTKEKFSLATFARQLPAVPGELATPVIRLFNEQGLTGFYSYLGSVHEGKPALGKHNDPDKVFSVEDGVLTISGKCPGNLVTLKEYANYRLRVEYQWGERTWPPREKLARSSGIILHAYGPDGAVRGNWMHGIKCQIAEGATGDLVVSGVDSTHRTRMTFPGQRRASGDKNDHRRMPYYYQPGAPLTTITAGMVRGLGSDPAVQNVKGFRGTNDFERPGEWNTLECVCDHDQIVIVVNGKVANAVCQTSPAKGRIAFVSMGAEIRFRSITLQPLE